MWKPDYKKTAGHPWIAMASEHLPAASMQLSDDDFEPIDNASYDCAESIPLFGEHAVVLLGEFAYWWVYSKEYERCLPRDEPLRGPSLVVYQSGKEVDELADMSLWRHSCELELPSGKLALFDPTFAPRTPTGPQHEVNLQPGAYSVYTYESHRDPIVWMEPKPVGFER